jgi:hypothetical protein
MLVKTIIKTGAFAAGIALAACGIAKADTTIFGVPGRLDNNRQCLVFQVTATDQSTDLGTFAIPLSLAAANTPPLVSTWDLLFAHSSQARIVTDASFSRHPLYFHPVDPVNCGPYGMVPRAADPDYTP